MQGRKYLVPLADMFNYAPLTAARPAGQSGAFFLKTHVLGLADGRTSSADADRVTHFTVRADRAVGKAGEQVFEDYGDNPSRIYLESHGFVPDHNPMDCAVLEVPDLSTLQRSLDNALSVSSHLQTALKAPLVADKRVLLRRIGLPEGGSSPCIRWDTAGLERAPVMYYMRLAAMDEAALARCTSRLDEASMRYFFQHCESRWFAVVG